MNNFLKIFFVFQLLNLQNCGQNIVIRFLYKIFVLLYSLYIIYCYSIIYKLKSQYKNSTKAVQNSTEFIQAFFFSTKLIAVEKKKNVDFQTSTKIQYKIENRLYCFCTELNNCVSVNYTVSVQKYNFLPTLHGHTPCETIYFYEL